MGMTWSADTSRVRTIYDKNSRLETTGNVARVLVLVVARLGDIAAVEFVLEDGLRVLLALLGGVGVVDVGLVAAGDLSFGRHIGGLVDLVGCLKSGC